MIPGRYGRIAAQLWTQSRTAGRMLAVACGVTCALGTGVAAQSAYACRGLETHAALPSVEGADGTFFRIRPDLESHQAMGAQTIAQMGVLSKALAARGTTLVFLPIPGRAHIMAHALPAGASFSGYDADIAWAVQVDMMRRLEAEGVVVADPRDMLKRAAMAGAEVFFGTDPRPTTTGSKIIAKVVADVLVAHPKTKDLPTARFRTARAEEDAVLPSAMRAQLQLACQNALPEVRTERFVTAGDVAAEVDASGVAAVIGTEMTGTQMLNFAGFLSELSGLRAGSYGVTRGGAYAAISSYLTSADFDAGPPQVLIWEVPVWAPFGSLGAQPMAELIAAASGSCDTPLVLTRGNTALSLNADLSGLGKNAALTLKLDTGGSAVDQATFHFTSADGQTRSRSIYRHRDQILTGRFFMPIGDLLETGVQRVEITLPDAFGGQASLSACVQGAYR